MKLDLIQSERRALTAVDVDEELTTWAGTANSKGLQWKSVIHWNHSRVRGAMHASSFQSDCDMKLYLDRIGDKPQSKSPPDMVKRFDLGTAAHSVMAYYQGTRAEYYGYGYYDEVSINDSDLAVELHLCGSVDGVSVGWPLRRRIIWEYKTISLRGAMKLKSPPLYYVKQVHVYMACLGIPMTIMTFIVKDDTRFISFRVPFSASLWEQLLQRIKRVNAAADRGVAPIRRSGQNCAFCGHRKTCDPQLNPHALTDIVPEFA